MHNKQFIISKRIFANRDFDNTPLKHGYVLNYHKELNVVKSGNSLLLGHAFQGDSSRETPEKELETMEDPIETYRTWNGRWALLFDNEIHPDACAQLGIFYGKIDDELVVSSSLALIANMYEGKCKFNEYMPLEYNLLLSWVPGPYTVIEGICRLFPTQYLVLEDDFKTRFRNPISTTEYSDLSLEEIYDKLYQIQEYTFRSIERYDFKRNEYNDQKKNVFNIGLTAGYDSRMQAALLKRMGVDIKAHTFERRKSTEYADIKYPRVLAQILDIEWNYIPIEKRQASKVIEYNNHTFNSVKDRDWKWHYPCGQYDKVDGNVIVSSSIWEAFCDYYVRFGSTAKLNDSRTEKYEDLKRIFDTLDGNPLAEKSFEKYVEWVDANPIDGLSWTDRIAFEQLMGIWDGNENQGKDLFSHDRFIFNPANSMEIFALILALPKEKRADRLWEKEVANFFVPEFEDIPYNKANKSVNINYLWPFGKELCNKKVVLYGAGAVGRSYYLQIVTQEKCKIVAWVDREFEKLQEVGINVDSPEVLIDIDYDYLIVAVESKKLYKSILNDLAQYGIDTKRVIWKETEEADV